MKNFANIAGRVWSFDSVEAGNVNEFPMVHAGDSAENFCRGRAGRREKGDRFGFFAEIAFGGGDEFNLDGRVWRRADPLDKNQGRGLASEEIDDLLFNGADFGHRLQEGFELNDIGS